MARGQQKIQSQQKNAEKLAKLKKAQGMDSKKSAQAALVYSCSVCKVCFYYKVFVFNRKIGYYFWYLFYIFSLNRMKYLLSLIELSMY